MNFKQLSKKFIIACFVLLSISFASAQQFRAAMPSEFNNSSPERFYEIGDTTVRSFTNPEIFSCYVHIIKSDKGNILIDPGYYNGDLQEYIKSIGGIDTVLLSHNHVDHIVGLNALKKDFPNMKVYIHALDLEGLYNIYTNYSFERLISEPFTIDFEVLPLESGDYFFNGRSVKLIHSPGHSPGSALFYFKDEGLLFVGDTVAFKRIPRYDLKNSNVPELFESLTRLKNLNIPSDTKIFFGHGEFINYGEMLKNFDCFRNPLSLNAKKLDGNFEEFSDLYFDDDILMLSLYDAAKIAGASYISRENSDEAVIFLPNVSRLKVKKGSSTAEFDGFTIEMKTPAQIRDGKFYLPGKFIATIFKNYLAWSLTIK